MKLMKLIGMQNIQEIRKSGENVVAWQIEEGGIDKKIPLSHVLR